MEENSRISVIVPVYRVEQYLEKCVSSIVGQTYKNLEIILVDDGSPDHCPQLCDDWAKRDTRIQVVHKKNGGLSDARNAGLHASTGDLILFVDSDDWIEPEMAEKLEEAIRVYHADMALCQFVKSFPDGSERRMFSKESEVTVYGQKEMMELLLGDLEISNHVWRRLYRRNILQEDPFPKGKNYEDIYVMAEIIGRCNTFVSLNTAYYHYRQNENGILKNKSYKNIADYLDALAKSYQDIQSAYPELKIEIDYAKARTTTYAWEDLHTSQKLTAAERDALKERVEEWGKDIPVDALKKMSWRNKIYYKCVMSHKDFLATVWYEVWYHEGNLFCTVRRTAKRLLKGNRIGDSAV